MKSFSVGRILGLRNYFAIAITLSCLAGCDVAVAQPITNPVVITQPPKNSQITNPVVATISVDTGNYCWGFKVKLDGNDVTGQFSPFPPWGGPSSATFQNLAPGVHTLTARAKMRRSAQHGRTCSDNVDTTNFTVSGLFTLQPSPDPLKVIRTGSSTLTVNVNRVGSFNGPVHVVVADLPPGVSANPPSFQVQGQSGITQIIASPIAVAGLNSGTLMGTSGSTSLATPFTVNVPSPTLTSVSPATPAIGQGITVTGADFDPVCAHNHVSISGPLGSVYITPNACSSTSLSFPLPSGTPYGPNQILVTTNNLSSNTKSLNVERRLGDFSEITSSVEGKVTGSSMCSTQLVQVQRCGYDGADGSSCNGYRNVVAYFKRQSQNTPIGTFSFHANNAQVSGVGGAGFGLCTVGVVLDADASAEYPNNLMSIQFLNLVQQGPAAPSNKYPFNLYTPSHNAYVPRIFQSADGTLLIVVTASSLVPSELTAAVFDLFNPGSMNTSCTSTNFSNAFSASVTTGNKIAISLANTSCVPITIQ